MNEQTGLDQVEDDILTYTVSDEAVEAAANTDVWALRSQRAPVMSFPCPTVPC
jgi:hypothetical protein